MWIQVLGTGIAADALRGKLNASRFVSVVETAASYRVRLEEDPSATAVTLDSIACEFETAVLKHLRQAVKLPVLVVTHEGNRSDREVRIVFPPALEVSQAVASGAELGMLQMVNVRATRPWYRKLWR